MNPISNWLTALRKSSRPQRRRQQRRGSVGLENLEQRALLSAIVGQAVAGPQQSTVNGVTIFNKDAVRVDESGEVVVTAGHQANDGKTDRFELKTASDRGVGGKGATQIWVNGKLAAMISANAGQETTLRIEGL